MSKILVITTSLRAKSNSDRLADEMIRGAMDRLNPLFPSDYRFRRVYLLSVAAEDEDYVPAKALSGLEGWVDCFEKAELAGSLFCGGMTDIGEAEHNTKGQEKAYAFGKQLQ